MAVGRFSAVIFDVFGTLVPAYRHAVVLGKKAAALRLDTAVFAPAFAEETRDARETGQITLAENLRAICAALGATVTDGELARAVALRRDFTARAQSPRDDALETLARLRARGLALAVISDCCEAVADLWESASIASHIDAGILSCRVGVRKPDPRIHQLACDALGVTASACLYVGDGGSHELTGALRAGMEAALLSVPGEFGDDPYRTEAAGWRGPVIHSLGELRTR